MKPINDQAWAKAYRKLNTEAVFAGKNQPYTSFLAQLDHLYVITIDTNHNVYRTILEESAP